jgi:hypothetical protein
MLETQFDEIFRNKLQGHSAPVPTYIWQRIQPKEANDRDRIVFWIWYIVLPLSLIVSFTGGYLIIKELKISNHRNTVPAVRQNMGSTPNNVVKSASHIAVDREPGDQAGLQPSGVLQPQAELQSSHERQSSNRMLSINSWGRPSLPPHPAIQPDNLQESTDGLQENASSPGARQLSGGLRKRAIETVIAKTSSPVHFVPPNKITTLFPDAAKNARKPFVIKSKPPVVKKSYCYVDVYASPDLPSFSLNASSLPSGEKNIQQTQLSYTIALNITKSLGSHFAGSIGLQYSGIKSKSTIRINDSSFLPNNIRLKNIDVPLLIGYTFGNDRFMAAINTGVIINMHSLYRELADNSIGNYNKINSGISLYFGLNLSQTVNDKIRVFAEPYFRYGLSNLKNEDQVFSQKLNITGLSLGVRYYLERHK